MYPLKIGFETAPIKRYADESSTNHTDHRHRRMLRVCHTRQPPLCVAGPDNLRGAAMTVYHLHSSLLLHPRRERETKSVLLLLLIGRCILVIGGTSGFFLGKRHNRMHGHFATQVGCLVCFGLK